jgi:hypothetical protein
MLLLLFMLLLLGLLLLFLLLLGLLLLLLLQWYKAEDVLCGEEIAYTLFTLVQVRLVFLAGYKPFIFTSHLTAQAATHVGVSTFAGVSLTR